MWIFMKNKRYYVLIIIIIIAILGYYLIINNTDAKRFKREYEAYNEIYDSAFDTYYRTVTIPISNPIKYVKANDIINLIKNKETFLVYFGDGSSHFCRLVIEELLRTLEDEGIKTIYYVNINGIRNEKTVSEEGSIVETSKSEGYDELLTLFEDVLDAYNLYDENDNIVLQEKTIYDSTLIAVVNGAPISQTMGINDYFTKVDMSLTEDILNAQHNDFKKVIDYIKPIQSCNEEVAC